VSGKTHLVRRIWGRVFALFALFALPLLVYLAWHNAYQFDPYTDSFFTKQYVEPTPGMPGEIRIMGWLFVGIGVLLALASLNAFIKKRVQFRDFAIGLWASVLVAAFAGAFFVAADTAEVRIEQEMGIETGQA